MTLPLYDPTVATVTDYDGTKVYLVSDIGTTFSYTIPKNAVIIYGQGVDKDKLIGTRCHLTFNAATVTAARFEKAGNDG